MKTKTKIIIGAVVVVLILGALCGGNSNNTSNVSTSQSVPETEKGNILMNAELKEADVMNGFGDTVLGQRAYIEITNDELNSITEEEFIEFADSKVKDSGYNYVTIIATDSSKAIFFPGSSTILVQYGDVRADGMLDNVIGYISLQEDGSYKYEVKSE